MSEHDGLCGCRYCPWCDYDEMARMCPPCEQANCARTMLIDTCLRTIRENRSPQAVALAEGILESEAERMVTG